VRIVAALLPGGINADNCQFFVERGASHVIVTSYVFRDGQIDFERLEKLKQLIGKAHLVLDLSCRKKADDNKFYVMTDRWQKFTTTAIECVPMNGEVASACRS
jgi:phosphoribosylformimino-5-aminoimidazole carboxamide ribotide isomerase